MSGPGTSGPGERSFARQRERRLRRNQAADACPRNRTPSLGRIV